MKVRALVIDGRVKEYALGMPHDVTERLFVVRRAFRVNDSLPEDSGPRWQWQRGGWLLVDGSQGTFLPSVFRSLMFSTPQPVGTATMLPTAAWPTMERKPLP